MGSILRRASPTKPPHAPSNLEACLQCNPPPPPPQIGGRIRPTSPICSADLLDFWISPICSADLRGFCEFANSFCRFTFSFYIGCSDWHLFLLPTKIRVCGPLGFIVPR